VSQPMPAQAVAAGASLRDDRRGKGPLRIATPAASDTGSNDEANVMCT
jgi:hypothetical protein